jgi:hypothetical protein
MPPQQSNRPLDVLDQLFRLGAHVDSLCPADLATVPQQRNPAFPQVGDLTHLLARDSLLWMRR